MDTKTSYYLKMAVVADNTNIKELNEKSKENKAQRI